MNEAAALRGDVRRPGGGAGPAVVTLGADGFTVGVGAKTPWAAAYRDVTRVVVDGGVVLVQLGSGPDPERWLFERFGPMLGALARGLRDGRMRQWLTDGLTELDDGEPVELVETSLGITQILPHARGIALAPLDERKPRFRIRRSDIGAVEAAVASGSLRIDGVAGRLAAGRALGEAGLTAEVDSLELRGLGASTTSHMRRWTALRDGAAADQAAIVATLVPDAPFEHRRRIGALLREGQPVDPSVVGDAWAALEGAVLVEPTFAASYRSLVAMTGGAATPRWLAVAPDTPGAPDRPRIWSFVELPGNLVTLELVSAGAHATYCFRVAPRAGHDGAANRPDALVHAVRDISEALLDARFLREPMAIPDARLVEPRYLRYRLAFAALPSLAAARSRFVARIVHRDPASWRAALEDLIAWHGSERDEAAEWPGRAAQEAAVDEAEAGTTDPLEG